MWVCVCVFLINFLINFFFQTSGAKKRKMRTEKGTKDFFFLKKLFGGRWEWENGPKSSLTL